ncbi:hypothetical protein DICPUDRAFT_28891 [Dictyostelium purpureum]|uniref:Glycerol kinase 5 n=1 Tax=Dictyostelium purpureum TaxID=5786 RepID=F0ZCK1_DICPU|nr:uncharacterized protein DICPUDRAFT_28891 [Dictyostelium purpureum]EGC38282.1 hypothetical protein DICPUDRAFT_28891 [Dictyostelium purpureum]|eukprot:XP_003285143.1 hypothetical protein DICPUDRAFT_28891 [Dictyostelium purpureum]
MNPISNTTTTTTTTTSTSYKTSEATTLDNNNLEENVKYLINNKDEKVLTNDTKSSPPSLGIPQPNNIPPPSPSLQKQSSLLENIEELILSIDVGTTNIRAIMFDKELNIISKSIQNIPLIVDDNKPGYIEQCPDRLWEACKIVMKEAIELSPAKDNVKLVKAIGITNQRSSFLTWRRDTGRPIHNLITWQDGRSGDICKNANNSLAVKGIHGATKFVHLFTGKPRYLMASQLDFSTAHSSTRLAWVLDNLPEAKKAAREQQMLFGTIDTWLLWNLTGGREHATDYSNISATGLFDPFEMKLNSVVFYLFNIPTHIMPKIYDTSHHYGSTLPELFGHPIPITALCGDQQSAMFGECCFEEGDTKLTIGTGCFVNINTGSQARASRSGMYPLVGWKIKDEVTYVMEGKGMAAGTAIDWAQSFGMFNDAWETSAMAFSVPHSQGVVFVPAFTGLAPPHNDPRARGLIIGMSPSTRKEHVVRALLESFGYRCKELIDGIIFDNYTSIRRIVADGGVCQNDFVMQFISDIVGGKIDRAAHPEMTASGVCMLAGLNVGVWKSKEELSKLRKSSRIFEPRMSKDIIRKLFKRWERAVKRSMFWSENSFAGEGDDGYLDIEEENRLRHLQEEQDQLNNSNLTTSPSIPKPSLPNKNK